MAPPTPNPFDAISTPVTTEENPFDAISTPVKLGSLRSRWKEAKNDPEARARLAKEIGQEFAQKSYGPRYRDYNLASATGLAGMVTSPAFQKTALDTALFGLGANIVQREARKTFPGMTVEESRIVRQEAERLQPELAPFETGVGAAAGIGTSMLSGLGAIKGGAALTTKLPGAARSFIEKNASKLAFRKATPTPKQLAANERVTFGQKAANVGMNFARAAPVGFASSAAYEGIAGERNPLEKPVELGVSTVASGLLPVVGPNVVAGATSVGKRFFFPKAKAKDIIEDTVGPQGAVLARKYKEETGQDLPVAAGALDPNTGARIAPFFPGPMDGAMAADAAADAMRKAAKERIARDLPAGVREAAKTIGARATAVANRFMQPIRAGAGGIETGTIATGLNQVLDAMRPTLGPKLSGLVNMIRTKTKDSTKAIPGELSLDDYEDIRRAAVALAETSIDPSVAPKVRELFRDPKGELLPKVEKLYPGYDDAVLGGYSSTKVTQSGAELAPKAFTETPETFSKSITDNIPAAQLGARELGASLGVAEELARRTGDDFQGPGRVMEQLTAPNIAGNVARTLGQPGRDLAKAAPEYVRASKATERLATPDVASLKTPSAKDAAQAATTQGTYFKTKVLSDWVNKLFMPMETRREIIRLLSDPAKAGEGVEALMRAQVRGDVPELSEVGLRRLLNRTVGRGETAKQLGMFTADDYSYDNTYQGDTRSEPEAAADRAMIVVNKAVVENTGYPMSDEEFYVADAMIRQMIASGMSLEDAITELIKVHAKPTSFAPDPNTRAVPSAPPVAGSDFYPPPR